MQRLFTGLQPSGNLHVGNYVGALKPFVELSQEYDSMLMVADYHALTSLKDPAGLRANIVNVTRDYLAVGIDPELATIFKQSDVPEHTELAWIFNCLVTVPFLMQAHAYKDKVAKGLEANAGLFAYPMLMAADILLYDTDVVPVGADQRQHIEYAREAATKFNHAFGETFKLPQERILAATSALPGTDGKKMSKSYGNTIPLFGTDDEIRKACMSITTDSTGAGQPLNPDTDTIFALHRHFSGPQLADIDTRYRAGAIGYKESKELLAANIIEHIRPMRERRDAITDEEVKRILVSGAERARIRASSKIADVRDKVGVTI